MSLAVPERTRCPLDAFYLREPTGLTLSASQTLIPATPLAPDGTTPDNVGEVEGMVGACRSQLHWTLKDVMA